ncbi:uncharacterized protein [Centruroides vittatus]|uniref:uncharacterized protein n=1 Tax=Centruroides vittatus TaxID=120091 RepID=UPI00350FA19B
MEFLFKENPELIHHRAEVLEVANLVCCKSLFGFEYRTYKQKRGVPMGSPISRLLCELVVRKIEEKKSNRGISNFIEITNDNEDGLNQKLEQKSFVVIHILDINIIFKKGHLSINVYTKSGHSPLYIPAQSNDPFRYKLAAFRALVRRDFLYCDNIMDRVKEIDLIMQIEESLGYRRNIIAGIVKKFEIGDTRISKQGPSKYTKCTFNRNVRSVIKKTVDSKRLTLILKRAPNLYKILRNDQGDIKKEDKAGVYRIPYENQQLRIKKKYIGVTTRNLGVRVRERKYDIRKRSNATVMAQMLRPKDP